MDDLEVGDLRVLTLSDKVPAEGNVFRAFSEARLVREGDGCFAVFVDDRRAMLMEAHFDAEFAKKETILCGGASASAAFSTCNGVLVERQETAPPLTRT